MFSREEADEYIDIGALNGIFVLGRSMGFIGEFTTSSLPLPSSWGCPASGAPDKPETQGDSEIQLKAKTKRRDGNFLTLNPLLSGHYLDQKRLKQGLYRHPWDDISYVLPEHMTM